jgi:Family of unknown function (DUF5996)
VSGSGQEAVPWQSPRSTRTRAPDLPALPSTAIRPAAAFCSRELGDFILPYDMVRSASSPDDVVLDFYQTYDAGAGLARWDRTTLDGPSAEWARDTGASDIPLAGCGAPRHATLALPSHSGPWLTQRTSDPLGYGLASLC